MKKTELFVVVNMNDYPLTNPCPKDEAKKILSDWLATGRSCYEGCKLVKVSVE